MAWSAELGRLDVLPPDQEILTAVQTLPPAYRHVVVAVVIHGLTYSQAAAALDLPVETIVSRLYRARRLLPMAIAYAAGPRGTGIDPAWSIGVGR